MSSSQIMFPEGSYEILKQFFFKNFIFQCLVLNWVIAWYQQESLFNIKSIRIVVIRKGNVCTFRTILKEREELEPWSTAPRPRLANNQRITLLPPMLRADINNRLWCSANLISSLSILVHTAFQEATVN